MIKRHVPRCHQEMCALLRTAKYLKETHFKDDNAVFDIDLRSKLRKYIKYIDSSHNLYEQILNSVLFLQYSNPFTKRNTFITYFLLHKLETHGEQ